MTMQEYSPYSTCYGTRAIHCLVAMLALPDPAPRKALLGLLYTANQTYILLELLNALGSLQNRNVREAAGKSLLSKRPKTLL